MKVGVIDTSCKRRDMIETALLKCNAERDVRDVGNVDTSFIETLDCDVTFIHIGNLREEPNKKRLNLGAAKKRL
ncbi:MAG: hypothetical protein MN733_35220, partial [Nitrososphaera sp.]|nr:hypothetical protein [Nitrososphaera sp.]